MADIQCTGYIDRSLGVIHHDWDACPIHETGEEPGVADTQHTPGPWVVYYDDDGVEIRAGADGGDVMGMFIHGEEMDANARLLASAPALLEALESLVGWFGEVDYTDYESGEIDESQLDWVGLHKVFYRAEQAIAKAKGEVTQ
jgi:hypothetical protein